MKNPDYHVNLDGEQENLFIDNAFYLLAHRERILRDSRMFFCPIPIQGSLAYIGSSGLSNPTLGIYLEWWWQVKDAMYTDSKGRRSLVYHLAGSPLSGGNHCSAVREDGKREMVTLLPFIDHWSPFMKLNQSYDEAKKQTPAYSIQEVLQILHEEDHVAINLSAKIDALFMTHEIEFLRKQAEKIQELCDEWCNKYTEPPTAFNEEKRYQLYEDYKIFETKVSREINNLKNQRKGLKAILKRMQINDRGNHREQVPLKNHTRGFLSRISSFLWK